MAVFLFLSGKDAGVHQFWWGRGDIHQEIGELMDDFRHKIMEKRGHN